MTGPSFDGHCNGRFVWRCSPVRLFGRRPSPPRQALILMRHSRYDNNSSRPGESLGVGIVSNRACRAVRARATPCSSRSRRSRTSRCRTCRSKSSPSRTRIGQPQTGSALTDRRVVSVGLDRGSTPIKEFSRAQHVLRSAPSSTFSQRALAGVFSVDGKNTITVNLAASRDGGCGWQRAVAPGKLSIASINKTSASNQDRVLAVTDLHRDSRGLAASSIFHSHAIFGAGFSILTAHCIDFRAGAIFRRAPLPRNLSGLKTYSSISHSLAHSLLKRRQAT